MERSLYNPILTSFLSFHSTVHVPVWNLVAITVASGEALSSHSVIPLTGHPVFFEQKTIENLHPGHKNVSQPENGSGSGYLETSQALVEILGCFETLVSHRWFNIKHEATSSSQGIIDFPSRRCSRIPKLGDPHQDSQFQHFSTSETKHVRRGFCLKEQDHWGIWTLNIQWHPHLWAILFHLQCLPRWC